MIITKNICDICGKEVRKVGNMNLQINSYGTKRNFDICEDCKKELEKRKADVEIEMSVNSTWWKENEDKNGDIDYGKFESVGNCEQGGISCPKCKHLNNMYLFKGKCERCGYEERK